MQSYDERLSAPRSWWLIAAGAAVALGLIALPFGTAATLAAVCCGGAAAAVLVSSYGSVRIRVVQGSLVAGDAKVPVEALGQAHPLDPAETSAWRTHRADPRAFMLLRAYIPTALRVEVVDPEDPTPYLYLSTRHPRRLAQALESAREGSPPGRQAAQEPEAPQDAEGTDDGTRRPEPEQARQSPK